MFRVSACVLAVSLVLAPALAAVCPDSCVCATRDGLHRATCSSLPDLYKFTLKQKHHNINILDLSHNNITKLTHELDRLTELVMLDLSTNGIMEINKFLHNAKKLVHLNLANNRLHSMSLLHLPASVSSLDLTNNLLQDVPANIEHLVSLEHLEMEGNPLDCSCKNIRARDRLLAENVIIDKVNCVSPPKFKGHSWLELKTKDICKTPQVQPNYLDMMMGDQPMDAERIGEESTALKSMSLASSSVLEQSHIIRGRSPSEDDDSHLFMKVGSATTVSPVNDIEGSGEAESTTISEFVEAKSVPRLSANILASDEILPVEGTYTTAEPLEGSGEGSGFGVLSYNFDDYNEPVKETTTPKLEALSPDPVRRIFDEDDDENATTEYPIPEAPSIFEGGKDWHSHVEPSVTTEKAATPQMTPDTTISQKVTKELESKVADADKDQPTHKTGTYVCIALIIVLLVGLIGFAIVKGQMRKSRDRRLLRQQKRDVEKASKEMVDMNKSLLGKPAVVESPAEKKVNGGKYELVPTHETHQKKGENGDVANGVKHTNTNGTNGVRTDSPRDTNQNKSSSIDNNLAEDKPGVHDTSFESSPDSRKDSHSLSSEDIFVPMHDEDTPRLNGNMESDVSHPLLNGDQNTDSDFLSPSRDYVPVYSPDMGRVRIKMTETPKPKTPVLVTRSRSNAGDIIITPALDGNLRKSTT